MSGLVIDKSTKKNILKNYWIGDFVTLTVKKIKSKKNLIILQASKNQSLEPTEEFYPNAYEEETFVEAEPIEEWVQAEDQDTGWDQWPETFDSAW